MREPNPFLDPRKMHPRLAVRIEQAQAEQADKRAEAGKHLAGVSLAGLVKTATDEANRGSDRQELDPSVLTPDQKRAYEHIMDRTLYATRAYDVCVEELMVSGADLEPVEQADVKRLLKYKLNDWYQAGVLDYVAQQIELIPELRMTLVAVPNVTLEAKDIVSLAETPRPSYFREGRANSKLYLAYSGAELSGPVVGDDPVRFSLIPSEYDKDIGAHRFEKQQTLLQQKLAAHPELDLHVPSVLDSIVHMMALRGAGNTLDNGDAATFRTHIRHINLRSRETIDGFAMLLDTYAQDGRIHLDQSPAIRALHMRAAIG